MIDLEQSHYGFQDLLEIMARLRQKEGGCPWDLAQTHESIRRNFIEEAYEAAEAIDQRDDAHLCEELGDLLFAAVNVARRLELDPEQALMRATQKFMKRFALVEQAAGDKLRTMSLPEMTALWEQAKQQTAGS